MRLLSKTCVKMAVYHSRSLHLSTALYEVKAHIISYCTLWKSQIEQVVGHFYVQVKIRPGRQKLFLSEDE